VAKSGQLSGKLRIKPGQQVAVVNGPPRCAASIPLLGGVDPDRADVVIGFAVRRADLELLTSMYAAARAGRGGWISYPRPGRLGTDLHPGWIARAVQQYGVKPVDQVSIDDTWSALLLQPTYESATAGANVDLLAWPGAIGGTGSCTDDRQYGRMLGHTMAELTQNVRSPIGIDAALNTVTAASVELIGGVDFADVLVISGAGQISSLAPTPQLPIDLAGLQQQFGEGPGMAAAAGASVIRCNDFARTTEWPRFAESAVAAGVRSMLAFRLETHDDRSAVLNLLGTEPHLFDTDTQALGAVLAAHAAIALIAHERAQQFESALASRDTIGQAKGMIMERFGLDAARAFKLLTRLSQQTHTRVAVVAAQITTRGPASPSSRHRRRSPPQHD
jgi:hypothetical protein